MDIEETYEWDDSEDDYPDDFDDASELIACPECGVDIYEDTEQCPACGNYVVHTREHVWQGRPLWWIVLGVLGLAAVIFVLAF